VIKQFFLTILIILTVLIGVIRADGIPQFYSRYDFLLAPPGSYDDGLVGFVNPADLTFLKSPEMDFYLTARNHEFSLWDHWGLFTGVRGLGFGVQSEKFGSQRATDYKISTGFGDDGFALGLAYGWSGGNNNAMGRERLITAGTIIRPMRYLSIGAIGNFSLESSDREWSFDLGIRPLGNSKLTLFGDIAMPKKYSFSGSPKSAGVAVEIVPGINAVGRYFKGKAFTLAVAINFGRARYSAQSHFDSNQDYAYTTYAVRSGGLRPSIFTPMIDKGKRFLALNLKGTVDYQKYVLFDDGTIRFYDLLNNIRAAADDPRVGAVVLNLSSMNVLPEHAWEIRQELMGVKQAGKTVIVFTDRANMTTFHLASVADKIVLDPEGEVQLYGYVLGKTYFKGTLEKLGLAFDEWRFFKYKSAMEPLSRDKMSDADREQYQDYVDDLYESVRADICRGRNISTDQFDKIVNEQTYLRPSEALELKLVDTLARWSDMGRIINKFTSVKMRGIAAGQLTDNALSSSNWGLKPEIAVVYGLGECAMDKGIRGRWLEEEFLRLRNDRNVKAVVFRVDSPGGDALPSDLVAVALRKCSEVKPVIVTQGQVAGSGGYWISMYGDTILAGPTTITGSIGVIGGWIYDKGLSTKLGMTSDFVKRGDHADLGYGITLPLVNIRVPSRNLTTDERDKMEVIIKKFYDVFVAKVAEGRRLPEDSVRKIAEGHFYSGLDGKSIGLIDRIGGLMPAIAIAKQKAGLKPEDECEIVETVKYKGFIKFNPPLSPVSTLMDPPVYNYLKLLSEHPGEPLPMLLPGTYPSLK